MLPNVHETYRHRSGYSETIELASDGIEVRGLRPAAKTHDVEAFDVEAHDAEADDAEADEVETDEVETTNEQTEEEAGLISRTSRCTVIKVGELNSTNENGTLI
jgi:hypothetical protein